MSAGITSQYGFLYQRYIFIKTVLDNVGMDKYFTYEGIDDVDISEIEGINSGSISTDTFIQVKSGTVSRDCWAKMLGNWLLIDHDNPAYIVFCENKLAFTINDEDVISGVCKYFAEGKTKKSTSICTFLRKSQSLMKDVNLEGLKTEIKRRERDLKGSRSKTLHPGEFDPNAWFGGGQLDYRFSNAMVIIKDIFESEGTYVKS